MQDRLDFNGTLTSYTYDALNRLLSRTSNHTNAALSDASFTYTASGRRWTMTDATGTTIYGYDHRDRLKTKATPQGTITYDYDDASGLLTGMHTDTPNGAGATYTYDELSRLETVSDVNAQTTTYEYDDNGNLEDVILPNGVTSTYAYSATNRLQTLSVQKAGANLAHFSYALAPTGHRHRSSEAGAALQPGNPVATRNRVWQYDALWRLRNETLAGCTALGNGQSLPNGSVTYTLDAVGNRLNRISTIAGLASQNFNYTSNDRVQGDLSDNNGNTLAGTVSQPAAIGTSGQDTYDAEPRCVASHRDRHRMRCPKGADAERRRLRQNRLITRTGAIGGIASNITVLYNGDGHSRGDRRAPRRTAFMQPAGADSVRRWKINVAETVTQNGVPVTTTHLIDDLNCRRQRPAEGPPAAVKGAVRATQCRCQRPALRLPAVEGRLRATQSTGYASRNRAASGRGEIDCANAQPEGLLPGGSNNQYDAFGELTRHSYHPRKITPEAE